MKSFAFIGMAAAMAGVFALAAAAPDECNGENWKACRGKPWVDGEVMETPLGSKWWPNPLWGAEDEAGSTNWYTQAEVVQRAIAQMKMGKVYRLGQTYSADMPLFGSRTFQLRIPSAPTGGPSGATRNIYHDDFLVTEVSQVGTQLDGLGHVGVQTGRTGDKNTMRWYNGFTALEINTPYGLAKLGAEKLHPIVARGILLDIAAARGVEHIEVGEIITLADVRAALRRQGMEGFEFKAGDALLFRTGWERFWKVDNEKYNSGEPGIGMEVARWAAEEVRAGLTGADTWGVDAVPDPDPACVFCVHNFLQTRHGIVNHENLTLAELARDRVYVFAYIFVPVPIQGATGSIGSPIAIR